ncbi:MAG: translation elongation factor 4 [Candidatus Portnoybacteria bacterium]|jgi:GTP-binding protein LepA|nr:translation elongation factor 4 [Candidatus Portnoybacteria bacterium]
MAENIRNFCIVAHIDHGKSTLADRFLELTGAVEKRKMRQQYLDTMDLERERGITIKLQPVRMKYACDGREYELNLIDTPGHVDFSYEVSRSLAAVEGAILLVDATKGVQAQTLANLYLAQQQKLTIIPAINKIDLPGARPAEVKEELRSVLGEEAGEILEISAKEGRGVAELLQGVIRRVPPPAATAEKKLRALVFDSSYDSYKGAIAYVRVKDGEVRRGDKIMLMASGARAELVEVGVFKPDLRPAEKLRAGEIGYLATGLKEVALCRVGDTVANWPLYSALKSLAGYQEPKPMIFASFYPIGGPESESQDYDLLKDALAKLKLNDAALFFEPESSDALGRGFKCGFLGMLHLEIVGERLRREYKLNLMVTIPSVVYQVSVKHINEIKTIFSPQQLPDASKVENISEPWVRLEIISPSEYLGMVMKLAQGLGGLYQDTQYLGTQRVVVVYEVPLREIIVDFYDKLKSATSGYASMGYELLGWRAGDLVCLDILVAGEKIEALSRLVPRAKAASEGRLMVEKLKEILPPQLFAVSLQAAVGGKVLAREDLRARRKDVTGYLYGGDVTRKRKLLEKQKKGKKKMKERGRVNIPQEVFLKILKK